MDKVWFHRSERSREYNWYKTTLDSIQMSRFRIRKGLWKRN